MTEEKKSKNPFVNMANEAKKKNNDIHPGLTKAPKKQGHKFKCNKTCWSWWIN